MKPSSSNSVPGEIMPLTCSSTRLANCSTLGMAESTFSPARRAALKVPPDSSRARYLLSAPTGGEIDMSLSLRITSRLASITPALLRASKACPADIAPSPMIATTRRSSPLLWAATAMPRAAEIEVEECPTPNVSYLLSIRRGKPETPSFMRRRSIPARRPVSALCG